MFGVCGAWALDYIGPGAREKPRLQGFGVLV